MEETKVQINDAVMDFDAANRWAAEPVLPDGEQWAADFLRRAARGFIAVREANKSKDAEIARLKTRVAFGVIGCADCDGALWAEMEACPTCSLREALTIARATVVQYGKLVHPGDLEVDSTLRRIDAALSKVEAK